ENLNGYDIIFVGDDDSTILDHQTEYYDASTGEYKAWVNIPSLNDSVQTEINLYYGNNAISTDPSTSAVWSPNYLGVYHFNQSVNDATSNGNNGTNNGTTDVAGYFGGGKSFDGIDDYIQTPISSLKTDSSFTLSLWFKTNALTKTHMLWAGYNTQNGWGSSGGAFEQEAHLSTASCCLPNETDSLLSAFLGNDEDETDAEVLTAQVVLNDTSSWHQAVATFENLYTLPVTPVISGWCFGSN
ncbi:MAG: DUF2341 domain-containing protein, partial [Bacteroidetes bacterium]|nr:DUF2341 domain-containing protein [Bacteroidota bacterium]